MLVFVFQLHPDNGTAILIEEATQLQGNLTVKSVDIGQIAWIVTTHLEGPAIHPIGNATVAHFPVAEGAHTDNNVKPMFLNQL